MRDHYRRGVRNAHTSLRLNGRAHTARATAESVRNLPRALVWGHRLKSSEAGPSPLRAWPMLLPATGAYVAGLVAGRYR